MWTRLSNDANSQLKWTQTSPFLPQNLNATHPYQPTSCWHANITHHQENRDFPANPTISPHLFHHRLSSPPAGFHTFPSKDVSVQTHSQITATKTTETPRLETHQEKKNPTTPKTTLKKNPRKPNHHGIQLTLKSASCWLMVSTSVPTTHCRASFSSAAVVMWLSSFRRL